MTKLEATKTQYVRVFSTSAENLNFKFPKVVQQHPSSGKCNFDFVANFVFENLLRFDKVR